MKRIKQVPILIFIILITIITVSCANIVEDNVTTETISSSAQPSYSTSEPFETEYSETEPMLFGENITFNYEYIDNGEVMPYGLFTPSSANEKDSIPLIVWLHGGGERDCTPTWFSNISLPKAINEWTLEGFNAYVVCPHLNWEWNVGYWNNAVAAKYVMDLINQFTLEHNIDTKNIVIAGHSLGGQGAMYMAIRYPDYFSKGVVISSIHLDNGDINEIKIPMLGCIENSQSRRHFLNTKFADVFGEENVWHYDATHGNIPNVAFNQDKNENNRSDLIEWMFDNN